MNKEPFNIIEIDDLTSVVHYNIIDFNTYDVAYVLFISFLFVLLLLILTKSKLKYISYKIWFFAIGILFIRLLFPGALFVSVPIISLGRISAQLIDFFNLTFFLHISLKTFFLFIWGLGIIVFLTRYTKNILKIYHITRNCFTVKDELLLELKKKLALDFPTKLIISDAISSPSEVGYFTQYIFINKKYFNDTDLKYIYCHELFHHKYMTQWIKLIIDLLEIFFWWNPLFYILKKVNSEFIEYFVDNKISKNFPGFIKKEYLSTLEKSYTNVKSSNHNVEQYLNSIIHKDDKLILLRFKRMTHNTYKNNIYNIIIIFIMTLYLFISCRYTVTPTWNDNYIQEDEAISADAYITQENGEYILHNNGEDFKNWDISLTPDIPIKKVE